MIKAKKKKHYVENIDLIEQIGLSKKLGRSTEKLGEMLMLMTRKIGGGFPYKSEDLRKDVYSGAMEHAIQQFGKWDPNVSGNAFSWYTSVILNKLKRELKRNTKIGIVHIPIDALI